jgi:hypothetical protein
MKVWLHQRLLPAANLQAHLQPQRKKPSDWLSGFMSGQVDAVPVGRKRLSHPKRTAPSFPPFILDEDQEAEDSEELPIWLAQVSDVDQEVWRQVIWSPPISQAGWKPCARSKPPLPAPRCWMRRTSW